jgi:hypothetical protein
MAKNLRLPPRLVPDHRLRYWTLAQYDEVGFFALVEIERLRLGRQRRALERPERP